MTTLLHGIPRPLPGERVLQVHPALDPQVLPSETWRRRTHLFTGRSLGPGALRTEQDERAGRMATSGQALSAGVIAGLEASVERVGGVWTLQVAPGFGVAISGEDVRLVQPLSVPVDELEVTLTREGTTETLPLAGWRDLPAWRAAHPDRLRPFNPFVGANSAQIGLPLIVVLQPIIVARVGEQNPEDACELDANDLAFEDEQIVDGVRVILVEFPATFTAQTVSPTWRNRLAYEIFAREAALAAGAVLPWEASGLGIGLLAIEAQGADPILDVHAVARDGGELNRRRTLFGAPGTRQLWQARVRQFIDQLGPVDPAVLATSALAARFVFLPPVGTLPNGALDVRGDRGEPHFPLPRTQLFPQTFVLEAAPVELEALDDYLRGSANLEPLDTRRAEQVQLLVPVPQRHFSPDLLQVEDETPDEFREAIFLFLLRLNHRLGRRSEVRLAEFRLADILFNEPPEHPERDELAVPGELTSLFPDDDQLPVNERPPEEEKYAANAEDVLRDVGLRMARTAGPAVLGQIITQLLAEPTGETPAQVNPSVTEAANLLVSTKCGGLGLVDFVAEVSKRLIAASEALDASFSRVSGNLFELRQLSSGDVLATQLAISPALPFVTRARSVSSAREQATHFKTFLDSEQTVPPIFPDRPPARTLQLLTRGLPGAESVPGAVTFNETIKQRLESSPALDLVENAARAKRAAFRALVSIHQAGLSLFGIRFRGFRVLSNINPETAAPPTTPPQGDNLREIPVNIQWVIAFIRLFDEFGYWRHDDVTGLNEGAILAASFESVEHSIAALRVAETRLAGIERALTLARQQLEIFLATWNRLQLRLRQLGQELDEFRRDVRVARALEAEEIARAKRVNAERREVLAEQVPFLVFRRPRTIDGCVPAPAVVVEAALAPDPVPSCLSGSFESPDQLRAMIDLLREAPLAWSPLGASLLPLVNRHLALHQVVRVALFRAANPAPTAYDPFATSAFDSESGRRMRAVFEAQRQAIGDLRAARLRLPFEHYARFSWSGLLAELRPVATLNDLILSAHGRQELSNALGKHLDDVHRVAACLFERLRAVQPILRFVWAQLLEQAATPVDLRELSVLPSWEAVDPSEQRDMQRLVDWLYRQVSREREDAVRYMHDLLRLVILLTSHAPVTQTLSAGVVNSRPVLAGGVLEIAIEAARVRVGMHVQLFESTGGVPPAADGVIEDLSRDGVATVRVATTEGNRSVLPVHAELTEPDRNPQVEIATGEVVSIGLVRLDR